MDKLVNLIEEMIDLKITLRKLPSWELGNEVERLTRVKEEMKHELIAIKDRTQKGL